jgi:hypothetical protein
VELEAPGRRVEEVDAPIVVWPNDNEASRRLATIPGVGRVTVRRDRGDPPYANQ